MECVQIRAWPKSVQVHVSCRKWVAKRNASWIQVQNLRQLASPFGQGFTFHWTVQDLEVFLVLSNSSLAVKGLRPLVPHQVPALPWHLNLVHIYTEPDRFLDSLKNHTRYTPSVYICNTVFRAIYTMDRFNDALALFAYTIGHFRIEKRTGTECVKLI